MPVFIVTTLYHVIINWINNIVLSGIYIVHKQVAEMCLSIIRVECLAKCVLMLCNLRSCMFSYLIN